MLPSFRLLARQSAQRTPAPASPGNRFVALEGVALLRAHAALVEAIQSVVGIPADHWAALYRPMLEAFAGLVQQLPASEAHHHAGPGGMLRHGLEVVIEALKLRRSALLPSGAPAEELARRQDLWTYACAAAALLHDIGKPAVDLRVTLLDAAGGTVEWSPLAGPMPVGTVYQVAFNPKRAYRRHERIAPLLAHQVVPAAGLRWLTSAPEVLDAWLAAIQGDLDEAGALGVIVGQADGLSVARDLAGGGRVRLPSARARPLADKLLAGLRHLLAEEVLPLNRPGAAGFVEGESLWLVSKRGLDALREHLIQSGQPGIPSRNDRLMDELQQHGLLLPNGDRAIWTCEVRLGDWTQRLTFLRLEVSRLWPDPERRPPALSSSVTPLPEEHGAPAQETSGGPPERENDPAQEVGQGSAEKTGGEDASARLAAMPDPTDPPPSPGAPTEGPDESTGVGRSPADREPETAGPGTDPRPPAEAEDGDLGTRFLAWLKRNVAEHRVELNTPKARLHVLPEGLALVSPGIFRDFDPARWQQAQKRFQKLKLHRKTPDDTNIWTCRVARDRKQSLIKVFLIPDPETRLGVRLPPPNAAVALLMTDRDHGKRFG
ncbi:MAG TPA: MobH family relaxase [Thiohalobacter sp.]|nr:MobH family relaxase [Thiohalobacter sp.]